MCAKAHISGQDSAPPDWRGGGMSDDVAEWSAAALSCSGVCAPMELSQGHVLRSYRLCVCCPDLQSREIFMGKFFFTI